MTPVVLVDMAVERRSPAGSCVRLQALALGEDRPVVVVTGGCDLTEQPGLRVVRVALPSGPVLLRYLVFQWQAARALRRLLPGLPAGTLVQCTQGQWPGAQVVYAHFCHTAYLRGGWAQAGVGRLRRWARWLNHRFNAWTEARAFGQAQVVVVPSMGLARKLVDVFPALQGRVRVVANPVDLSGFQRPEVFDRAGQRAALRLEPQALVLSFVALGNFEHKGLGLLVQALAALPPSLRGRLQLLVVGGQAGEVARYRELAEQAGVADRLVFAGLQKDVRPFLWASDAFTLPSAYETFSLAVLQASAAGLPVLVSQGLHGTEDYLEDGRQGWFVERSVAGLVHGLTRVVEGAERLPAMSLEALAVVQRYSEPAFQAAWRAFYSDRH